MRSISPITQERAIPRTEIAILAAGVSFYFLSLLIWRPVLEVPLLIIGAIVFAGAYYLPRRLGVLDQPGQEPLAVWFIAFICFSMPVAAGPSPRGHGFIAATIGTLTAQGIWAIYRYGVPLPVSRDRSLINDIVWGGRLGLLIAAAFSVYVIGLFTVFSLLGRKNLFADVTLPLIVAAYFGGGLLGGGLAGLLRPLARHPLGAMVMGVIVAFPVYEVIGLIMPFIDARSRNTTFSEQIMDACGIALMIGPPVALMVSRNRKVGRKST